VLYFVAEDLWKLGDISLVMRKGPKEVDGFVSDDFTVVKTIYRAPETIERGEFNFKADIWSLGCILSELVEGTPLFRDEGMILK
jgi:serine/threonine protein kinase